MEFSGLAAGINPQCLQLAHAAVVQHPPEERGRQHAVAHAPEQRAAHLPRPLGLRGQKVPHVHAQQIGVLQQNLAVLAVIRAGRRREVKFYAWLMPASTVVQAIIGGITVRTGLLWWTVAVHLLVSMVMVWLAVLLYVKIGEPDSGTDELVVPRPLRWFTALTAVTLSAVLVTGTLVTGAGPHAGDKSALQPVKRLQVEITDLAHVHSSLLVAYLSFVIGLGFALLAVRAPKPVLLRLAVLAGLVLAQGAVGAVQFYTGVPAVLVAIHVAGAAACIDVPPLIRRGSVMAAMGVR